MELHHGMMRSDPLRLEEMCMRALDKYITLVVMDLYASYNIDWDSGSAMDMVLQSVKNYLVANLHPFLIDLLLEVATTSVSFLGETEKQMLLEIFMHENMLRFNPAFRVLSPVPRSFYENKISRMNHIVELNLKMVATDAILSVVGKSCPNLEVIDIVSRIGTLQKSPISKINALRLEFFVSDDGLKSLHPCKRLKVIIMRKIVGSNCAGKHVTYDGIRQLLVTLPKLEYIRYNNMGYVIGGTDCSYLGGLRFPDGRSHFNLLHLHDDQASESHIRKLGVLCPKLKTLCLNVPPQLGNNNDTERAGKCLDALTDTDLTVSALSLRGFSDDNSFSRFCWTKGAAICHLKLHSGAEISTESLQTIGRCCPNIVTLDFVTCSNLGRCSSDFVPLHGKCFRKLENLTVIGQNVDLETVLSICTLAATFLQTLTLINYGVTISSGTALLKLMKFNDLSHLRSFFCFGFELNLDHLLKFLDNTRSLRMVSISEDLSYAEFLRDVKLRHNLQYDVNDAKPIRAFCHCLDFA